MRFASTALLLTTLAAAGGSQAHAKDMSGRFGIGADSSMGFYNGNNGGPARQLFRVPGLAFTYHVNQLFGLQFIVGSRVASQEFLGTRTTAHDLGIAFRGTFTVISTPSVNFDVVAGVSALHAGVIVENGNGDADVDLSTEAGVRPEWFLVDDHLSIHTAVGLVIAAPENDDVHVNLFGSANLLGNAGFTFYF